MTYKLFIDDERFPVGRLPKLKSFLAKSSLKLFGYDIFNFFIIARNYDQVKNIVEKYGIPSYISFDHDLGEEKTGYDIVNFLIEQDLDGSNHFPSKFDFYVHSQNPIGKQNIEKLLNSYIQFKGCRD